MLDQSILNKIKLIKLQTRRKLSSLAVGQHKSSQKGYGLEFDQLRDYEIGDDIRYIDWKGSARGQKLLVKQYIHEYSKTILICIDISFSTEYGSALLAKKTILAQVATVLAIVSEYDKAQVGLILFSDSIQEFIRPKMGAAHIQFIIEKIWKAQPQRRTTNLKSVFSLLGLLKRKDSITFILSDFIDQNDFVKDLYLISKKYELIAIRCLDNYERRFCPNAFIHMIDAEQGGKIFLDARKNAGLDLFLQQRASQQEKEFKKAGMKLLDIDPHKDFMNELIAFCAHRMVY